MIREETTEEKQIVYDTPKEVIVKKTFYVCSDGMRFIEKDIAEAHERLREIPFKEWGFDPDDYSGTWYKITSNADAEFLRKYFNVVGNDVKYDGTDRWYLISYHYNNNGRDYSTATTLEKVKKDLMDALNTLPDKEES